MIEYLADGSLKLPGAPALPDILDLLVVGGGPAGTAAAFRARELGLAALVIDYDDLMKRIRDYAKDKLILPDFGGGDKMRFPKGGAMTDALAFGAIEKDAMCELWKSYYAQFQIPAQIGIELLGVERQSAGYLTVRAYNHNTKTEVAYKTRNVALGIGRGVPRRFDIPGNTEGIAYRLTSGDAYVGAPACVIGGGTSAAEAVIEISKAKIAAGDASAVYWSYRGDKLPKVSKALAEVFFDAYIGNGNIRYHPNSEPVAVMSGDDRRDYLAVRIDRRAIANRPNESLLIEFLKESCVACIGEDIPETLLASMGIAMATGGPSNKKRMVVNRFLETQQPGIFLIGDILTQAYLETEDFSADPATFSEIKHRGNIKAALVDGVLVAEVVRQRIDGVADVSAVVAFADEPAAAPAAQRRTMLPDAAAAPLETDVPAASMPANRREADSDAFLVRVLPGGVEEAEFPLKRDGVTTLGRGNCDVSIPGDELLSDAHASILHTREGYFLRDDGSATGVYYRAPEGKMLELAAGSVVRLGRQFLVIERNNGRFGFIHYTATGDEIQRKELDERAMVLGRDAPDVTLAADDMVLSRRHIALMVKDGSLFLKDLKSLNGTFLKVQNQIALEQNDQFRVGRQTFRVNLAKEVRNDQRHSGMSPSFDELAAKRSDRSAAPAPAAPASTPVAPAPPAASLAAGGLAVTFRALGKTVPFEKGKSICEIAEKNGIKIVAECHAGICGSDPIRVCAGQANLNTLSAAEKETLEDICELAPGEYRLACMARPTGAVDVDIM